MHPWAAGTNLHRTQGPIRGVWDSHNYKAELDSLVWVVVSNSYR